jgi:hypothetical protein
MSENINNQFDFFKNVKLDENGAIAVTFSGSSVGDDTNLSEGTTTNTTVNIDSSTGNNATIQPASTSRAGVMPKAKFDEVVANNSKVSNVSTDLSEGTTTTTTVDVNSSDGTNATLAEASTSRAGVMSKQKFDEVTANTLKSNDPRVDESSSTATLTVNTTTTDQSNLTAQSQALTINTPIGITAASKLIIRIKDNGTARALTFNASFRPIGTTLPATTVASKMLYLGIIYCSTDDKWDVVSVAQEV